MSQLRQFQESVFAIPAADFEAKALALFRWQAIRNPTYRAYLKYLRVDVKSVDSLPKIPFLPIEFFKRHRVLSTADEPIEAIFASSGTTGQQRSRHYVTSLSFYHRVCQRIFEQRFGPLSSYHIVALLPSYLERQDASLVSMVDYFIRQSQSSYSGFYLDDFDALVRTLEAAQRSDRRVLLIGVTFALLQLAETYAPDLSEVTILETGGMKGMRRELVREEVHRILCDQTRAQRIYSEYGMTELLSQAYTSGAGSFVSPPWMRIRIREVNDPRSIMGYAKSGGVNVIDLANVHSCAFIETMDRGVVYRDHTFEILGRLDNSDIRGCNTMLT